LKAKNVKRRRVLRLVLILCLGVIVIGCRAIVNHFTFFPDRSGVPDASQLPPGVAEVFIPTADGERLHCYHLADPDADTLLLYFHGNAGHIGHRIPELQRLADMRLNVLGVGYRGYGKSTGRPSEAGIYTDGEAALSHAQKLGFGPERIVLLGRSLGSTVAVEIARGRPLQAVILVTPFSSGEAMGRLMGLGPLARLAGDAFDNLAKIKELRTSLLIVHGTADEVVPFAMGQDLYAAALEPKRFIAVLNGMHNNLEITTAGPYWNAIQAFINDLEHPAKPDAPAQ
jgi:fermentation-respiration switch protein FrsA (DUF1100 family)